MNSFLSIALSSAAFIHLIDTIAEGASIGINQILLLPSCAESELLASELGDAVASAIDNKTQRNGGGSRVVSPYELTLPWSDWLGYLTASDANSMTLEEFFESYCWMTATVTILGNNDPDLAQKAFRRVLDWSSRVSRRSQPQVYRSPAICLIATVDETSDCQELPTGEPLLSVHTLWGMPSATELRTICQQLEPAGNAETLWRECIVAGLGAGDVMLSQNLWRSRFKSQQEIIEHVMTMWDPLPIGTHVPRAPVEPLRPPRSPLFSAWASGRAVGSPEYGSEFHLSAIPGDHSALREEVLHRLWRAQVQTVMVATDRTRREGIETIRRFTGSQWEKWVTESSMTDYERRRIHGDPWDAQLGFLSWLSDKLEIEHRQLFSPVSLRLRHANEARRMVAHFEPVDYPIFSKVF